MDRASSSSDAPSLFQPHAEGAALTVTELTTGIRELVEMEFDDVWVEGELSNFKRHTSGHCYFTLKDAGAQLRGVLWRGMARHVYFEPRDGMLVRVRGQVSLYAARGDIQLVARSMRLAGEGALQQAFEALKQRLSAEGLFDAVHKKPLPPFPECIGIVTSGTGAALQDMLSILQRRFPQVRVLVCPVQVQGMGAAEAVAEALEAFNDLPAGDPLRPDLLLVGRGGGSIEDLWAFNEERVARAIFASEIPVVSAVGHETDVTIADYVADIRAATPSMAAELAVPDRYQVEALVRGLHATLAERVQGLVRDHRARVHHLTQSYSFRRPLDQLRQYQQRLDDQADRLHRAAGRRLEALRQQVVVAEGRLRLLDPGWPLRRGYVRVERDGRPVGHAAELDTGDRVLLRFVDGARGATIEGAPDAAE